MVKIPPLSQFEQRNNIFKKASAGNDLETARRDKVGMEKKDLQATKNSF